jgi:nischarin
MFSVANADCFEVLSFPLWIYCRQSVYFALMSCFLLNTEKTEILIPSYETIENVEFYKIVVKCWYEKEWHVIRRYRDFFEIHETLKREAALLIDLPGKKMIKNREFIEKRREQLEKYLRSCMRTLQHSTPLELVEFLDFHKYDVVFLLQKLAQKLSQQQSTTSRSENKQTFTILEVRCSSKT